MARVHDAQHATRLALCFQVAKLDEMEARDPERREMLVTLLYVLQDAPEALLREMWKDVSAFLQRTSKRTTSLALKLCLRPLLPVFVTASRFDACAPLKLTMHPAMIAVCTSLRILSVQHCWRRWR